MKDEEGAMPSEIHVSPETLVDYQAERLTEAEDRKIEEHLAECDACAEVSRRVFQLSSAWDRVMTPAARWASGPAEPAASTVAASESAWLERLAGTLQGAALVALEGARLTIKNCARLIEEVRPPTSANIDALLARNAAWSFDLVPEAARGLQRGPDVADPTNAPARPLPGVVQSRSQSKGVLRVAVDRSTRQIVVTIDGFPHDPEPLPVVKLMRKNGKTVTGTWTPRPTREGFRDLRAVFVVSDPDEYVVGTE